MLHYPTLPKHKSKRKLKKYSHSKLRKDKAFRGIKVYTYHIGDHCYFTSNPKQKGAKAYPYKYALWLIRYYNRVMGKK
jgi:hypothetical protein